MEEDEPSDFVRFDKFQPVMIKIITERKYRPSTEEQLVKAFEVSSPTHVCTYTAQRNGFVPRLLLLLNGCCAKGLTDVGTS